MTPDKQTPKPFTPTLSASFSRQNRSPLTPKLAAPGGYRSPKLATPSEPPPPTPAAAPLPRYDSESSLLSTNVTPRSGSRVSRRDHATTTASPIPSSNIHSSSQPFFAPPSAPQTPASGGGGYRAEQRSPVRAAGPRLDPARTTRAKTVTAEQPHSASRPHSALDMGSNSPMFFHASDARSTNTNPETEARQPRPLPKGSPAATFVYADGRQENRSPDESRGMMPRRSSGLSRSVVSKAPSSLSPRLMSPKVDPPRLSDGVVSQSSSQQDAYASPEIPIPRVQSPPASTVSMGPVLNPRHVKSSSLDSAQSGASKTNGTTREGIGLGLKPSPIIVSPSDSRVDLEAAASEPLPALRPRIFSNGSAASIDTYASAAPSPQKSESGNDPYANARTERKIMDLEISNSSLLAINRTLEREMRQQKAELRRYRRLSRSGRLSMAPSGRSVSGNSLSVMSEVDENSELSSVRSPEDGMSDFSDEDSVVDEGVLSPDALAEHDSRHRAHDEKRFFVDLTKHQELLADSQKMNQSLKRCLGWTEELIKEATKALEYNVHVNDVQLGGRVLSSDDPHELGESSGHGAWNQRDERPRTAISVADSETETGTETETAGTTDIDEMSTIPTPNGDVEPTNTP